jgi:hypothetical protein
MQEETREKRQFFCYNYLNNLNFKNKSDKNKNLRI